MHGLYLTGNPWLEAQPLSALVIANLVGMMVSYRLSRYWTFRHRQPVHADGGRTAFFLINVVTLPLSVGTLWFSRHVLGLTDPVSDNLFGNVIGALIGQAARFYLFRTYVFRKPVRRRVTLLEPVPTAPTGSRPTTWPTRSPSAGGPRDRSTVAEPPTRSRSSGRLSPTTLWWSPSIPVTNAPPSPSTVNAPATCSGSPEAT